jgi:hypothetical protein
MHLDRKRIGNQPALPWACIKMMSVMFKITQNTLRDFTLAEILLMAAMNQIEAKRRIGGNWGSQRDDCPYRAKAA